MKSTILTFALLITLLVLQAQECFISGVIKGVGQDTFTILIIPLKLGSDVIVDKVICHNGKFEYQTKLNMSMMHLARIYKKNEVQNNVDVAPYRLEETRIKFFIQPGERLTINAKAEDDGMVFDVSGSKLSDQYNLFSKATHSLIKGYNNHCLNFADAKGSMDSLRIKDEIRAIDGISRKIDQVTINYILEHPDWEYSAELLMGLPGDSCFKYYERLGDFAQESFFGQHAKDVLFAIKVGEPAPQFTLPDTNGRLINLSDFKGKYVILDFWGSWCGYCILEIPRIKEYYNRYSESIEFIGIGCKDSKQSWLNAIEKNEMNWTNLFNENEELTTNYGIEGYPSKLIVSPDGIIIKKYIGSDEAFFSLLDELFKTNKP